MIFMKALLLVLLSLAPPVQAEVFKCTISNFNIVYQATPCTDAAEQKIEIKPRTAEEEAAATASLKAWDAKYATEQAAEDKALKAKKNKMPRGKAQRSIPKHTLYYYRPRKTGYPLKTGQFVR
jgi:hypothetical protein